VPSEANSDSAGRRGAMPASVHLTSHGNKFTPMSNVHLGNSVTPTHRGNHEYFADTRGKLNFLILGVSNLALGRLWGQRLIFIIPVEH